MAKSYHISFNGTGWTQFYPSNSPLITWEREGDEMFLRYSVDEFRIAKSNNTSIYNTIDSMFFDSTEFDSPLYFKIQKSGVDKFFFKSSVNEAEIDSQNGVFEIKPRTNDSYESILGKYDVVYQDSTANNLFGVANSFYVQTENTNSFANQDFDVFNDGVSLSWENTTGGVQYALQTLDEGTGLNHQFQVVITSFAGDDVDLSLVRADGTTVNSNVEVVSGNGIYTLTQNSATASVYLRLRNQDLGPGGSGSGSFVYVAYTPTVYTSRGKLLKTLIEDLLGSNYMDLSYDVVSTYLWNDALETDAPSGIDTYITANPSNDYVIEGAAVWNGLFVTKTHTFTTDKEAITEITFGDLMSTLKTKLRAWWFIDSDGKIRIEHEKYFRDYSSQLDITTATYSLYKPEVDARIYTYDKGDIVSVLNYSESNMNTDDFIAAPIIYDQSLTTPNSKDIIPALDISTDLDYVIDTSNSITNTGFTLLRCTVSGSKYFVNLDESYYNTGVYYLNQKLSYAHLFSNYWTYFGEAATADINSGNTLTLEGVKTFLKQSDIRMFYSGELNWIKPVTLNNGTGWIEKMEETESEFLTINVGFDPYL